MSTDLGVKDEPGRRRLRAWNWAALAAIYTVCVALATWPRALWFRTGLPSLGDPLQHLWIMRWYRTCLMEGQSPVLCPEIQYPTGAPLGCFSPLHFQSLLYIPLSFLIRNDVLAYNVLWLLGIVFTGMATFLLIRQTGADRWCAGFGGMLAMLSGPMMLHAEGHLELIYLGGYPLFLWSWIRLVDQPTLGRLAAAAVLYLLLATIAAYYAVFAIVPAVMYVGWKLAVEGRSGAWPWIRSRTGWLAAFAALVLPGLLLEFGNQLWAMSNGYVLPKSLMEFKIHGAPIWAYACPTAFHPLGRLLPNDPYEAEGLGKTIGECGSYLGLITVALLAYTAVCRVRFPRMSYWWSVLAVMVVLSGGASWTIGGYEVALPALWLKKHVFLFKLIRVPARFNLFVAVVAAVVASNGLRHLLSRLPTRRPRAIAFLALSGLALGDLAVVPSNACWIPPMPGCYAYMKQADPHGAFVEIPQFGSGGSLLYAICGYWQANHRGHTTAGYCGQGNALFDNLLVWNSPFQATKLAEPGYLSDPDHLEIDVVGASRFRDYAWLYMKAHGFRFAVLHQWPGSVPELPVRLDRLKSALAEAKVFEDAGSVVYDLERLPAPTRPVLLTTEGWRPAWQGKMIRVANRQARLALYNPDDRAELRLKLDALAFKRARQVRLLDGERELSRWEIRPGDFRTLETATFELSPGIHRLVLESDSEDRPKSWRDASMVGDLTPYSLKIAKVDIECATTVAEGKRQVK